MREICLHFKLKSTLLGVDCHALFNADETIVIFSMVGKYTYTWRGSRTVATKGAHLMRG
jgi:hypothetical protein